MATTKSCIFCDIRDGLIPSAIVHEDDETLAFLDRSPLFEGHLLVVPKTHVVTVMDLPDALDQSMFHRTKLLAQAVQTAMQCDGIFIASNNLVSQSVAHLHIHIVPRRKGDGLRGFFWPRTKYESEEAMHSIASRIREARR